MSEVLERAPAAVAHPQGPPPPPPPGPIAQSVAIGFKAIYLAMALLALLWGMSNIREIAPDSQAVVLRFGRIVRTQQAGLLVAWPSPFEQVRLLPGPARQLSQEVSVLQPESDKARALITPTGDSGTLPRNVAPYLTGDGNVVLLNATLIYRIDDPVGWTLSQVHVPAALDRLFRDATVRVTAARTLNDFLVVAAPEAAGSAGESGVALRSEVRSALLDAINSRLRQLADAGASLGVEIQRIDMTAWLPPQAKVAFDQVLTATQAADRGVAIARTDAERRRQEADREKDRLIAAAQATAQELISTANVNTAQILALEHEETPETRRSILLREYRARVGTIMAHVGSATVIDPRSGVRFVLPGKKPTP